MWPRPASRRPWPSGHSYKVRTAFEREARRMSGYYYGKQIVDEFMLALSKDTVDALGRPMRSSPPRPIRASALCSWI